MMLPFADQRVELSVIEVTLITIIHVIAAANISAICIRNYTAKCAVYSSREIAFSGNFRPCYLPLSLIIFAHYRTGNHFRVLT
jgi:hypothetical protein